MSAFVMKPTLFSVTRVLVYTEDDKFVLWLAISQGRGKIFPTSKDSGYSLNLHTQLAQKLQKTEDSE